MIFELLWVLLNAWFLYYVEELKLHGCACALGWKRLFIMASLVVFIAVLIVSTFFRWETVVPGLVPVYVLVALSYVIVARMFIDDIKRAHCKCAEGEALTALNIVNVVQIIGIVVTAVYVLYLILVHRRGRGRGELKNKRGSRRGLRG